MNTHTPALLVLLALPLALAACRSPRDTTADPDTVGASAATRVDQQAEEQKIRGLERRWREALAAKDSVAVGRFYAEEGFYLPQGSNGYEGSEKIRGRWASEFTGGKFDLEREPKKIEVADAGDMAYEVGTYKVSWDKPREHRKGQGAGNYVTVWKKENGEWKTAAYIWNRGEQR
jgi:ketosteroid isomerase-like protein